MIKGVPLTLADGQTYIIPPISLGALEMLQDRIEAYTGGVDRESVSTIVDAGLAALARNYPELTRAQVAELIDLGNMIDVFEAVMDISGLKRKALEAAAAGEAEGASSSASVD